MNRHDHDLARRLYAMPEPDTLAASLPDIADGLHGALCELSRDPAPDQCDAMLSRLQSASTAITRLRQSLMQGRR